MHVPMASTTDISIVIPTVDGRKAWLSKTIAGYEKETPGAEIITVSEFASCGEAWQEGWRLSTRKYVHFTADDIVPVADWWQEAVRMLDAGVVPICYVTNAYSHGREVLGARLPLGKLGEPHNVMVPFLTREMLDGGGWLLPIHYGSDVWVTYWAALSGYALKLCPSYKVTHYLAPQGRVPHRQLRDNLSLVEAMEGAGYLPPYYGWSRTRRG